MPKKSIKQLNLTDRRVFVRVDFNVPLKGGVIGDDTRIRETLPTIRYALEQRARVVVLASHLGRPKGKPNPEMSLAPVAKRLGELLGQPVNFAEDCVGPPAERAVKDAPRGGVLLLENLRFHPEEEKNDSRFAKQLAALADVYVNDAFGAAHRAHASVEAIVPSETLGVEDPRIGNRMGLDIGPQTIDAYSRALADAKTVVWNGPMGVFEIDAFARGTMAIAHAVADVRGTTIIGGGDSI